MYEVDSDEGCWNSDREGFEDSNIGHRPGSQGRVFFRLPPVDSLQDIRFRHVRKRWREMGVPVEVHHHEGGDRRTVRNRNPLSTLWCVVPT